MLNVVATVPDRFRRLLDHFLNGVTADAGEHVFQGAPDLVFSIPAVDAGDLRHDHQQRAMDSIVAARAAASFGALSSDQSDAVSLSSGQMSFFCMRIGRAPLPRSAATGVPGGGYGGRLCSGLAGQDGNAGGQAPARPDVRCDGHVGRGVRAGSGGGVASRWTADMSPSRAAFW